MRDEPIDSELLKRYMDPWVEYINGKIQRELDELFGSGPVTESPVEDGLK